MIPTTPPVLSATPALDRRSLLKGGLLGLGLAGAPLSAQIGGRGFTHGVASGEPAQDRVLLWTRYVSADEARLEWEVSDTAEFTRIVSSGNVTASPARDHCCKTFANGLEPERWYFYRFIAPGGASSDIGRTRTLPEGPTERFRMAVFSCSNIGFGWFNAYAHAAEANEFDVALHLGDYIYEYGRGTYPSLEEAHPQRSLNPASEIVALADYRLRYATYRADRDLRRLHQVMPMIAVWDDHESANDSWKDGAQNHQPETEGEWDARKAAAKRVYREWMPVSDEPYASYEVGDLATLFRLDTRLEGREEQFSFADILAGKQSAADAQAALIAFRDGAYADPERHLLGTAQEQWLGDGLRQSRGDGKTWQVLVQQVLMGRLSTPSSIVDGLGDGVPAFVRQRLMAAAMASATGLPANMDAWDGYPAARERVLASALEADANLLVLAGDTHNGWAFELDHEGSGAGIEFGTHSVTSPGLESALSMLPPGDFARATVASNDQLAWADTSQRGYTAVELTPERASAEFRFLSTVRERSSELAGTKRITSLAGSHALDLG